MSFIGIITDKKREKECYEIISDKINANIVMINEENIENIKNIRFETIVLNGKIINHQDMVRRILKNTKILIINMDIEENIKLIENLKLMAITFGFHSKCTVTASSIDEYEVIVCLQRNINIENKKNIEPQEISREIVIDVYTTIFITILSLIYKQKK